MSRYLITTAEERSWRFDQPILFLGEWCRRYDRKHVWSAMDAIVAAPYGLEPDQKRRDIARVYYLAESLLSELTAALNKVHMTEHSERYWNIVLGHWLQRYVAVAFNRYHALEKTLREYKINGTTILDAQNYSLATRDSLSFIWACNDPLWNHMLYSRIIAYWDDAELDIHHTAPPPNEIICIEFERPNAQARKLRRKLRSIAGAISQRLSRKEDAFIVNTYLPLQHEIRLQISLGQLPQLWRSPAFDSEQADRRLRTQLRLEQNQYAGFDKYVRLQLAEVIPTCYLEGYGGLVSRTKDLPWPERPKFVFTSNSFDTDEIFKVWTASKVEQGIPYFAGQHGNNYGTLLGNANWPERVTSDHFLTWGWTDDRPNTTPAFLFKTAGFRAKKFDRRGGVLLIELPLPHRHSPSDNYNEFAQYQEDQFRFVEILPTHIHRALTVRLHHIFKEMDWFEDRRWQARRPSTRLELGSAPIRDLMAQSRLVIHSYDSTGILETLALNIPTMCFWRGGLDHLEASAKSYYELLMEVGILVDSPEQLAKLVVDRWDNIDEWWNSSRVQQVREIFCNRYARQQARPVRALTRLLTQAASRQAVVEPQLKKLR